MAGETIAGFARRLLRRFIKHPMDKASKIVQTAVGSLLRKVDEGKRSGAVTNATDPLYSTLVNPPFYDQLFETGFGDSESILSCYLQLMYQQLWWLRIAFRTDPAIEHHVGQGFDSFVEAFCKVTGTGGPFLQDVFASADKVYLNPSMGFERC